MSQKATILQRILRKSATSSGIHRTALERASNRMQILLRYQQARRKGNILAQQVEERASTKLGVVLRRRMTQDLRLQLETENVSSNLQSAMRTGNILSAKKALSVGTEGELATKLGISLRIQQSREFAEASRRKIMSQKATILQASFRQSLAKKDMSTAINRRDLTEASHRTQSMLRSEQARRKLQILAQHMYERASTKEVGAVLRRRMTQDLRLQLETENVSSNLQSAMRTRNILAAKKALSAGTEGELATKLGISLCIQQSREFAEASRRKIMSQKATILQAIFRQNLAKKDMSTAINRRD